MKTRITRISPHPVAITVSSIVFIVALLEIIFTYVELGNMAAENAFFEDSAISFIDLLIAPLLSFGFAYLLTAVCVMAYNILTRVTGGLVIEVDTTEEV